MTSLLGPLVHLSPVVPAVAAFGILSFATLDTLNWQGRAGTLIVDWFNRFSPAHQTRVVQHEAGHFLVAYLLDIRVTGYTLSAWEAFRQGQAGLGGVSFDSQELETAATQKTLPVQLLDRYLTVLMAGIAAETLLYGDPQGGVDDRQLFQTLWATLDRPASEGELKQRWAILQAKNFIEAHRPAYDALVTAMTQKASVEECYQVIQQADS